MYRVTYVAGYIATKQNTGRPNCLALRSLSADSLATRSVM